MMPTILSISLGEMGRVRLCSLRRFMTCVVNSLHACGGRRGSDMGLCCPTRTQLPPGCWGKAALGAGGPSHVPVPSPCVWPQDPTHAVQESWQLSWGSQGSRVTTALLLPCSSPSPSPRPQPDPRGEEQLAQPLCQLQAGAGCEWGPAHTSLPGGRCLGRAALSPVPGTPLQH